MSGWAQVDPAHICRGEMFQHLAAGQNLTRPNKTSLGMLLLKPRHFCNVWVTGFSICRFAMVFYRFSLAFCFSTNLFGPYTTRLLRQRCQSHEAQGLRSLKSFLGGTTRLGGRQLARVLLGAELGGLQTSSPRSYDFTFQKKNWFKNHEKSKKNRKKTEVLKAKKPIIHLARLYL